MLAFKIYGQLPRKSNRRRNVRNRRTGKPMSIKSKEALDYEKAFLYQVPMAAKRYLQGSLVLFAKIYYRSRRSDLSDELLCDLLQKSGVIKNDRDIELKVLWRGIDKMNPRVEIWLGKYDQNVLIRGVFPEGLVYMDQDCVTESNSWPVKEVRNDGT